MSAPADALLAQTNQRRPDRHAAGPRPGLVGCCNHLTGVSEGSNDTCSLDADL